MAFIRLRLLIMIQICFQINKSQGSELISENKTSLDAQITSNLCNGNVCPDLNSTTTATTTTRADINRKKVDSSWFSRGNISSFHYLNSPNAKNHDSVPPCQRQARCEPFIMNVSTCFGAPLVHRLTTVELIGQNITQHHIQKELLKWQSSLRNIPKCWAMIQTLLCAVYMPRCENGIVDLPSQDMCRAVRGPCRVVEQTIGWPTFLRCDAEGNFPTQCKAEPRELRFSTNGRCPQNLVPTEISRSWYDGWDGCGLECHNPLFTEKERFDVHTLIKIAGTICLLCSLFTVLTFFIDWKSANKYPALIIFYINGCFLIITIGWMAQFSEGARDDIVCRKDGILRKSEPSSGENLACVIVFVLVYYFLMAACVWFVILTYCWFLSFKALGKIRDTIHARAAYFHLVAWSLPLVLTITILAIAEVDGDSVNGICFVGYDNVIVKVGFVLLPIFACACTGEILLIKGLIVLVKLKLGSDDIISVKASAKIRETIARLVAFATIVFITVLTGFIGHIYQYIYRDEWDSSLRNYIMCKSNLTSSHFNETAFKDEIENCQLESRPNVILIQLQLLLMFGFGVMMCTWIWTASTIETWKRFIQRAFKKPVNEPVKLSKHKMIAKAFAKRKEINGGRMSFSFQSTHDDPLGMNFDFNSVVSPEISSNWHAVLPKLIARRGAFDDGKGARRNSSASDMSQMKASNDSQETRRQSLDSQISFHMSEQDRRQYLANARQQRRKRKKEVKRKSRNSRVVPMMGVANLNHPRRGSDTSQHSDFGHLIPHHLLPAKIESGDQSTIVLNHSIERPNIGISRMAFPDTANLTFDRGTNSNLAVESVALNMPELIENEIQSSLNDCEEISLNGLNGEDVDTHLLSDYQLSNCIVTRATVDSQSDIEMKSLGSNQSYRRNRKKSNQSQTKETDSETCLQQEEEENTIVDMDMDDDNRDSLSS
ncbi:hypothetical protein CHUAL_010547 [Chamberlinius hualienensis]